MRLSTNWLNEYTALPEDLEGFCDQLTMAGLEVEEVHRLSAADLAEAGGAGERDDVVLHVKITPNRGDWLSVLGVARESAPLLKTPINLPSLPANFNSDEQVSITIKDPDLCRRYTGVLIKGVKIGPSPGWMQDRLVAAGMRPINNIVDITNYVMLELGQPLHAFDVSLLRGRCIVVRRAEAGESITTIDNQERKLDENILVIADADRPVALAGVMGGVESEINTDTTDILLESANFDPVSVRKTSKRHGLSTESSYRFERGVDPSICEFAAVRAAQLMADLANAESVGNPNDVYPQKVKPIEVRVSPEKANKLLGMDIALEDMLEALEGYGILASNCENEILCRVPTFRPDIISDVDLIEEIGRGIGYEKIPMTLPNILQQGKNSIEGDLILKLRRILMSCGLQEVLSHSIVEGELALLSGREDVVVLKNPFTAELNSMRRMLIPNLLDTLVRNQSHSHKSIGLFECGKIYFTDPKSKYDETYSVAGLVSGSVWNNSWGMGKNAPTHDFFSCKGIVEAVLAELGIQGAEFKANPDPLLHPTRAAEIYVGSKKLGIIGQIAPKVAQSIDMRGEAFAFELDIQTLLGEISGAAKYTELPRLPSVSRHITMKIAESAAYEQVAAAVQESGANYLKGVQLMDIYRGENLGAGVKSVTISMDFRADDHTLTDEQVNESLECIRQTLANKLGAEL